MFTSFFTVILLCVTTVMVSKRLDSPSSLAVGDVKPKRAQKSLNLDIMLIIVRRHEGGKGANTCIGLKYTVKNAFLLSVYVINIDFQVINLRLGF